MCRADHRIRHLPRTRVPRDRNRAVVRAQYCDDRLYPTMHLVNSSSVPIEHRKSPRGSFEIVRRHISVALGAKRNVGAWGNGHPFEVEVAQIPPGKKGYPYHSHAAQTEYYAVLS